MLELRSHFGTVEALTAQMDALRAGGYRFVASFNPGDDEAAAVAGFKVLEDLVIGRYLYVDDLSTREPYRSQGHGAALIAWLEAEGRRLGCTSLTLVSGVHRFAAHRFYFRERMAIVAHHFRKEL